MTPAPIVLQEWQRGAELRACQLCNHGDKSTGRCKAPEVGPVPFDRARAKGGACGPEAEHLTFAGLQ